VRRSSVDGHNCWRPGRSQEPRPDFPGKVAAKQKMVDCFFYLRTQRVQALVKLEQNEGVQLELGWEGGVNNLAQRGALEVKN
jgi:hypothetical protein